ncbi:hypothetical protein ACGTN6_20065 [Halomonas sp. THAF12]|uniref:hypothetical protein n=1 Tax=Halomonas sp. B23F22_10 TaxID=3459515 RepID=UPI00373FADAC
MASRGQLNALLAGGSFPIIGFFAIDCSFIAAGFHLLNDQRMLAVAYNTESLYQLWQSPKRIRSASITIKKHPLKSQPRDHKNALSNIARNFSQRPESLIQND